MESIVLFLCTGNYYRSRFAEFLFNDRAKQSGLNWFAESRGLALEFGEQNIGPISPYTLDGLRIRGIYSPAIHRNPLLLQHDDIINAQLIIALDQSEHYHYIQQRFPQILEAVEYWQIGDIHQTDPYVALAAIDRAVAALVAQLQEFRDH